MPERSVEEILFSEESQERMREAVRQAVNAADAAGLRPAYQPAFSKLQQLEMMADEAGSLNLEFHRTLADVLYAPAQPGTWLKQQALNLLQRWDTDNVCDVAYTAKWRELLSLPAELGTAAMLSEDEFGTHMRLNSPFIFLTRKN